MNIFLIH